MGDPRGWPPGQVPPPAQVPPPGYGQPPPGQYYPPPQGFPGYAPPPGFNPYATAPVATNPAIVLLIGALAGPLVQLLVILPISVLVNYLAFGVPLERGISGLLLAYGKSGVPTLVLTIVASLVQGLLMGLARLGIRSTGGWIAAGTVIGLVVRLLFATILLPLLGGFPVGFVSRVPLGWVLLIGYNLAWSLLVAAILAVSTRR